MIDPSKPIDENTRVLCVLLGSAVNRETKEIDGKEYAVTESPDGEGFFFYNPFVDGNEALELLSIGGFMVMPNADSKSPNTAWFCVVNGKHAIPGSDPKEAICFATYALLSGQIEEKERQQLIVPEKKIILADR